MYLQSRFKSAKTSYMTFKKGMKRDIHSQGVETYKGKLCLCTHPYNNNVKFLGLSNFREEIQQSERSSCQKMTVMPQL